MQELDEEVHAKGFVNLKVQWTDEGLAQGWPSHYDQGSLRSRQEMAGSLF